MKNQPKSILILLALATFVASLNTQALPTPPAGKRWVVVPALTDEFNSFDSSKWQKGHPYWSGRAPSVYNNANISYGNGLMRLQMTPANTSKSGNWIYAACVTSRTKAFTVGMYAEVQIKVANLSAVSSFWMQGNYSEIDVIENWGTVKNSQWAYLSKQMSANTHYFPNGWANDIKTPKNFANPNGVANASGYFSYGVWWKDNRTVIYYRNGSATSVGSVTTGGAFNEPMYMFFDMEPFTWGPGLPTVADLQNGGINSAYYNYVHTWKLH